MSSAEKDNYDERVDAFFQQNAWMDKEADMQWCSKTLFPGVGNSEQEKVIFADNVRFQQSKEFHEACRNEINATVYMLLENHTDKIQPIDAGCGRMMKVKIAAAIDRWLEAVDNLDKWHDKLSAKDRRILTTRWTREAWSGLKENKGFLKRLFEKTRWLLTIDGSGDEYITPQGLEDYHFKRHGYTYIDNVQEGAGHTMTLHALELHALHVTCTFLFCSLLNWQQGCFCFCS